MGITRKGFRRAMDPAYDEIDNFAAGAAFNSLVAASGVLTAAGNPANDDTVTIGNRVYTFKTTLTGAANEVLRGANASDSLDNFIAAIMGTAGEGTTYGAGTKPHASVTAAAGAGDTVDITAKVAGSAGNAIVTTETGAQLSFAWPTLVRGQKISVKETGYGPFRKTVLTLDQVWVTMADEGGVGGWGGVKLYDFAQGRVVALTARAALSTIDKLSVGTNIVAQWDGDFSLGTAVANNDADLSDAGEGNLIASTSVPQGAAGPSPPAGRTAVSAIGPAAAVYLDGTVTPIDLYLNFLIDDADQTIGAGPAYLIVTGAIELVWIDGGDI